MFDLDCGGDWMALRLGCAGLRIVLGKVAEFPLAPMAAGPTAAGTVSAIVAGKAGLRRHHRDLPRQPVFSPATHGTRRSARGRRN